MATNMSTIQTTKQATKQEALVNERIFEARREKVWQAWSEPERFMRWWGPAIYTSPSCKMDFRVGGKYLWCMRSPEGQDFYSAGVFREIVKPQRIVYTDSFVDEKGNIVPAEKYGLAPGFAKELLVTVTFEELPGGKTKLTLRQEGIPAGEMSELTRAGWLGSFDKLAESLK